MQNTNGSMSRSQQVIARFGGQTALARILGMTASNVHHWAASGTIPERWHEQLLALATEKGIALDPDELKLNTPTAAPELSDQSVATTETPVAVSSNGHRPELSLDATLAEAQNAWMSTEQRIATLQAQVDALSTLFEPLVDYIIELETALAGAKEWAERIEAVVHR
jgi:hypothetical protein